jgi:hypothetical protein
MATANNMKIIFDPHHRTARLTPPNVAANYASTWADNSAFCDGSSASIDARALRCPSMTVGCCDVVVGYSHWPKINCLLQLTPPARGVALSTDRELGFPRQQSQSGSLPPAPVEVGRFHALGAPKRRWRQRRFCIGDDFISGGHRFPGGGGAKKQSRHASTVGRVAATATPTRSARDTSSAKDRTCIFSITLWRWAFAFGTA